VGDVGDGPIALDEEPRRGFDARLGEKLPRRQAEHPLHQPLEPVERQPDALRQRIEPDLLRVTGLQVLDGPREPAVTGVELVGPVQVAGDSDESGDGLARVERRFERQAPASAAAGIEVQLEPVADLDSLSNDELILRGVARTERLRKDLLCREPEQLRAVFDPTSLEQRVVHPCVPPQSILGEEDDVRKLTEELLEQPRVDRSGRGVRRGRHLDFTPS
jgi:hypothetical protein